MFARARTFQASLESDFRKDHPNGDHDSVFRAELKTLLTTYYEDLRKIVGASGQEATRVLKHRRSNQPPPVLPASSGNEPAPVLPAGGPPPPAAAGAAEPAGEPEPRPAAAPTSPAAARASGKGPGGRGGKNK
jgi:hypothetical protein